MGSTTLPRIGLGTWSVTDPVDCVEAIRTGLEIGYRHVDTARSYGNEHFIGTALAESDVPREEVFVATKVHCEDLSRADVFASVSASLEALGVDTVDLLYVHSPREAYEPTETLPAFDELVDRGWIRHVGLANFPPTELAEATDVLSHDVLAHQVETHPLLQQPELLDIADREGFEHVAHTPLARGRVMDLEVLRDIAAERDTSPARVCLAWLLEKGAAVIPRSTDPRHLRENLSAADLELDATEISRIDAVRHEHRERVNNTPSMDAYTPSQPE